MTILFMFICISCLFFRVLHRDRAPLEVGSLYWELRDSVVNCELMMLRILQFHVTFNNPHKVIKSKPHHICFPSLSLHFFKIKNEVFVTIRYNKCRTLYCKYNKLNRKLKGNWIVDEFYKISVCTKKLNQSLAELCCKLQSSQGCS